MSINMQNIDLISPLILEIYLTHCFESLSASPGKIIHTSFK